MNPPARSDPDALILDACQDAAGYRFRTPSLLRAALTHTSGANTRTASNERMEFLGDSVLGLVACELLYARFPDYQEGDLTKFKSALVSRRTCAQFSRDLGLGEFLFLGKGMPSAQMIPMNMLADVFEALVAAIFLDGGYDAAKAFIAGLIAPEVEKLAESATATNAKSQLQTLAQRLFGSTPRYVVLDEQGPDHDRCFKIVAEINGHRYPPVWGRNKKDAEVQAAAEALSAMTSEGAARK